jgi:hypothetical protein
MGGTGSVALLFEMIRQPRCKSYAAMMPTRAPYAHGETCFTDFEKRFKGEAYEGDDLFEIRACQ